MPVDRQADAVAPRASLHGHIYRHLPNGLETLRTTHLSQENRWGPCIRPCPYGRTCENAGTTLMERANSELALRSCHHAHRLRRTPPGISRTEGRAATTFCRRLAAD